MKRILIILGLISSLVVSLGVTKTKVRTVTLDNHFVSRHCLSTSYNLNDSYTGTSCGNMIDGDVKSHAVCSSSSSYQINDWGTNNKAETTGSYTCYKVTKANGACTITLKQNNCYLKFLKHNTDATKAFTLSGIRF